MALFTEPAETRPPRRALRVAAACVVLVVLLGIGAAVRLLWPTPTTPVVLPPRLTAEPKDRDAPVGGLDITSDVPGASVALDGQAVGPAPHSIARLAAGPHRVRIERPGYDAWEQTAHIVPGVTTKIAARLTRAPGRVSILSDVEGASIFLDRKYAGRAPLVLEDVPLGPHAISGAAEGYETQTESVAVISGSQTVSLRFKEVRLDERLAVVHRHSIGHCEGRLVATTAGIRYETENAKDAFSAPLGTIERIEVDYLRKNLRLKLRGGRTYNFTGETESADPLLVFAQHVDRARARVAASASEP
jgi:hypothetical protein